MQPPRALYEIRKVLGDEDILISDVGLHKLWIGRMYPAHEPDTCIIANGLAGMGFALPAAIAAKLVHPDRNVITVNGDGGFLMNFQELETAKRLRTSFVNVVWENQQYGSIVWKQDKKFGEHFGVDFTNPDFVKLAESFGLPAWRCESAEDFPRRLREALPTTGPRWWCCRSTTRSTLRSPRSWVPRLSRHERAVGRRERPQAAVDRRRVEGRRAAARSSPSRTPPPARRSPRWPTARPTTPRRP